MVKKINKKLSNYKNITGSINISIDNLLDILSDESIFSNVKFTANNKDNSFDSLDDMKSNRELLKGRPEINGKFEEYNYFTIKFTDGAEVSSIYLQNEDQLTKLTKISIALEQFRNPLSVFRYLNIWFCLISYPMFIILWLNIVVPVFFNVPENITKIDKSIITLTSLIVFIYTFKIAIYFLSKPVYLGVIPPLWIRIKDKIFTHLVTLILGIGLTYFATKIGLISP